MTAPNEAEAADAPDRAKPLRGVELHLEVNDPELTAELLERPEGAARERYALAALRVGILSFKSAAGQVDAGRLRETGDRILGEVRELLATRSADLSEKLAGALREYLDPDSGHLPRRIRSLVERDGELERALERHLGPEESTLARSLAAHLGEGSPVLRMLSPNEAEGLKAQLERTLAEALAEQREKVVAQFSRDDKRSALSRLVGEIAERQGELGKDLEKQIGALVDEFSSDAEGSALNRLTRLLAEASEQIRANLTLDDERSALSTLKRGLDETLERFERRDREFQKEVRDTLAEFRVRREEEERGTRHGATFEEQLGALLSREAQRIGDVCEATGSTTGVIKNCKVGDFVWSLGPESPAPGARIVIEAKEDRSYQIKKALEEIEEGRKNRGAQIGVFVFSAKTAPDGLETLGRYGGDLVVVWDAESPSSDLAVRAALAAARALLVREDREGDAAEALAGVERAVRAVEKQAKRLDQLCTWAQTIRGNAEKIDDGARVMAEELERQLAALDERVSTLRGA